MLLFDGNISHALKERMLTAFDAEWLDSFENEIRTPNTFVFYEGRAESAY